MLGRCSKSVIPAGPPASTSEGEAGEIQSSDSEIPSSSPPISDPEVVAGGENSGTETPAPEPAPADAPLESSATDQPSE